MTSRADPVSKVIYRSVLHYARQFDKNTAAKALIQRYGAVRPPSDDIDVTRGDRRLYAAALEVVVGSQCHVRPERLTWSLQRLVRNMRRADQNNLEIVAERAVENQNTGSDGSPLVDRQSWEEDAMAAISLETFFPGELRGVEGADKVNAGFAALRELSSKWALAKSLGLAERDGDDDDEEGTVVTKRRRRRVARPRHKMTKRAMRVLRHQERHASQADSKGHRRTSSGTSSQNASEESVCSGLLVTPTEIPAKGVFLISHPLAGLHAPGDIFHRSVVFLVHHDAEGSYGLVVNKDRGETLEEALSSDAVPVAPDALKRVLGNPVRTGGPVMSRLAWLHHHEEVGGVKLSQESEHPVFFCGAMEKASELLGEGVAEPMDFSVLVGASSWLGGQLRGELDHGMWIMAKAPASVAFAGGKDLWRDMLKAMGGPYAEMSRVPHGHHWAQIGVKSSPSDWS